MQIIKLLHFFVAFQYIFNGTIKYSFIFLLKCRIANKRSIFEKVNIPDILEKMLENAKQLS
jgi:hypothetical protein